MFGRKRLRVAAGFVVQDIGYVALLPDVDRPGLVGRGVGITHLGKKRAQLGWLGMRKFDKLEAIGAGRVFVRNRSFRGIVRERAHVNLLWLTCVDAVLSHRLRLCCA